MKTEAFKKFGIIFSWALYDLANQFFALNIVSLYFVRWLTLERQAPEVLYSIAFGVSTFFVAVLGLVLGGISDISGRRRPFLVYLTLISIIFTMILGASDNILLALLFFGIANFGCQTAIIFYNALLVNIAPRGKVGLISGLGKMMGYSGAVIALYLVKPIVLEKGYQATFLPTGFLFLLFSLPCLLFVKDKPHAGQPASSGRIKPWSIFPRLFAAFKQIGNYPGLADFLKSAFFGLCAVNAIVLFMSIYASRAFLMNESQVIQLITFSTFFALFGSFFSGWISDYIGHKRCLVGVFILWGVCFLFGALIRNPSWYWSIGAIAGVALGSTWVVSRAMVINMIPAEKSGEVFGLFNLVGYLAAIFGGLFWGLLVFCFAPLGESGYRLTLLSLILFILLGLIFLARVPYAKKSHAG